MMQMSSCCMLWYECPHSACYDANVRLVHAMIRMPLVGMSWCKYTLVCMPWCRCNLVGMQWCKYTLVGMLWCRCPHGACHDANVRLWVCHDVNVPLVHTMIRMPFVGMSWCKCTLIGMPWCRCKLVGMHWCKCTLVGMLWCRCRHGACHDANVPLWYAMMRMPPCGCIMTRMLWCNHNLFKNSFYFQSEASLVPEIQIFSKLNLFFPKNHLLFYLRLPKKLVITVRNLRMGALIWKSDDLAQKIYFHNLVEQKGGLFPRPFFLEKRILWKSSILKGFIFF